MTLDRFEILRYLGYTNQSIDDNINHLLNECITEINTLMHKKFVYDIFKIDKKEDSIIFKDTILTMKSKDIAKHLAHSDQCALMAVSLGLEVDRKIAYYAKTNITKSLILDACASTAVEALCDLVQEEIRNKACDHGYHITSRFSPGYGDLPITLQKSITQVLEAYSKIGLTVSENDIMLPRKSVTAIIGWQKEEAKAIINKCRLCNKHNCSFRRAEYK